MKNKRLESQTNVTRPQFENEFSRAICSDRKRYDTWPLSQRDRIDRIDRLKGPGRIARTASSAISLSLSLSLFRQVRMIIS